MAVVLNRFDDNHELHRRNHDWLGGRDGYAMVTLPGGEQTLVDLVAGSPS